MDGQDGQGLHDQIVEALRGRRRVILDFSGVNVLLSAFLNPAVGALYREFEPDYLQKQLTFENYSPVQSGIINEVLQNAKGHFLGGKDQEAQADALRKMFPE